MDNLTFQKAQVTDISGIWDIIAAAILRRKQEGSEQWQDGYPNLAQIENDIAQAYGFVFKIDNEIVAYAALIPKDEPAYKNIEGEWCTSGEFLVVHRIAVASRYLGKGLAKKMMMEAEHYARVLDLGSIRVDTNYDNAAMLGILKNLDYVYCGKVSMRGKERLAFEKALNHKLSILIHTVYLLLGSNLGDRKSYLDQAVSAIAFKIGRVQATSQIYETASWGKTDLPSYLNQVVKVDTHFSAEQVLNICQEIERVAGRTRLEKWESRTLDVDILLYDDKIIQTENLTVPHPHMASRRFVLQPLEEIAKAYIHPITLQSIVQMLESCEDTLPVKVYQVEE